MCPTKNSKQANMSKQLPAKCLNLSYWQKYGQNSAKSKAKKIKKIKKNFSKRDGLGNRNTIPHPELRNVF